MAHEYSECKATLIFALLEKNYEDLACVKSGVGKPIWAYKKLANFAAFLALEPFVLAAKPVAPVEKQSEHSS